MISLPFSATVVSVSVLTVRTSFTPKVAMRCDNDSLRVDELDDGVGDVARLLAAVIVMMAESKVTCHQSKLSRRIWSNHVYWQCIFFTI